MSEVDTRTKSPGGGGAPDKPPLPPEGPLTPRPKKRKYRYRKLYENLKAAGVKRALFDLDVTEISLVPVAANRRQFVAKSVDDGETLVEKVVEIVKADAAKRMVYGLVYVPGEVDAEGDAMTAEEIEKAMHRFMQQQRTGAVDADHDHEVGKGYVAESWLLKAGEDGDVVDPLFSDEVAGAWAVGIKVEDEATWARVEKGELTGLSLFGKSKAETFEESGVGGLESGVETPKGFKAVLLDVLSKAGIIEPVGVAMGEGIQDADAVQVGDETGVGTDAPPVSKGFGAKMLKRQMWQIVDALSDSLREVIEDDDVVDKVAAVSALCDEFKAWITSQVTAVAKGGEPEVIEGNRFGVVVEKARARQEAEAERMADVVGAAVEKALQPLAKRVASVEDRADLLSDDVSGALERLGAVEKSTAGRSSVLGGEDVVRKEGKGYKGARFV